MNSEKREEEDDEAATQGEGREKVTGPRRDPAPTSARRLGLKENTRHIYPIPYLLRLQSMAYARSLSLECPSTNAPWRRGSSCLTCAVGGPPPPRATTIKGDLARKATPSRRPSKHPGHLLYLSPRPDLEEERVPSASLSQPPRLIRCDEAKEISHGGGEGERGKGGEGVCKPRPALLVCMSRCNMYEAQRIWLDGKSSRGNCKQLLSLLRG